MGEARRDPVIFTLLPEEFAASTLVDFPLEAYDSAESRVLGASSVEDSRAVPADRG